MLANCQVTFIYIALLTIQIVTKHIFIAFICFYSQKKMKYSCSKDPSFASVGKHGVLREFTFFDKVRFINKIEMYVSGSKSAIAIGFITQSQPLNNFIYFFRFAVCSRVRRCTRISYAVLLCSIRKWFQGPNSCSLWLHSWGKKDLNRACLFNPVCFHKVHFAALSCRSWVICLIL